jgi:hypothetical protein
MAEHKFVYSVSGINLSEAQQSRISQAIGVAVAQVLTGDGQGPIHTDYLNAIKIHGGKWISAEEATKVGLANVLAAPEGGK